MSPGHPAGQGQAQDANPEPGYLEKVYTAPFSKMMGFFFSGPALCLTNLFISQEHIIMAGLQQILTKCLIMNALINIQSRKSLCLNF